MDLQANILPFIDSNSIHDYPTFTLARLIIVCCSITFFKSLQLFWIKVMGIEIRRAFRIVSLTHSTIAVTGSLYVLLNYYSILAYPSTHCKPIKYGEYVISISFGYFIYDLYKTITEEPSWPFILHGALCIAIYGIVIHTAAGMAIGLSVLLYECSTIFFHSYAFLHYGGYNYASSICRFVFAFLFFIVRICFGSYLTIQLVHAYVFKPSYIEWYCVPPYKYWTAVIINVLFHCLNLYWFNLIVAKAFKVWREGRFEEKGEKLEFDQRRQQQSFEMKDKSKQQ